MAGLRLLQEHYIRFHIIMVLTQAALKHPDEVWGFCMQEQLADLCFNVEEAEGANLHSSLEHCDADSLYRAFLSRIVDLRGRFAPNVHIREIDPLLSNIKFGDRDIRSAENTPFSILSFDCDGNFSTFSPELLTMKHSQLGRFIFGNVRADSLRNLTNHEHYIRVAADIRSGIQRCRRECDYFSMCGGGAPVNKLCENGTFDSTETFYCRLRIKAAVDVGLIHLENELQIRKR
jgi:uncharacterized protein